MVIESDPCYTIIEEGHEDEHELPVTFFPPLYLQRRVFILDALRRYSITEVLDVGCGEGSLLAALSQPAPWLSDPSPSSPSSPDTIPNLHPTRIIGLDTSEADLAFAKSAVAPAPEPEEGSFLRPHIRWETMVAELWKGGLAVINESFVGIQCIVSSEVIEHLAPEVLPFFAPVLLGVYHPEYCIITTPSYTFNARFTTPTAPATVRKGYKDPTGRTDRIFRHDDHKFEWTVEEFEQWCTTEAKNWGYEVQTSSIGRATQEDQFGRDEELGGASLVAVFTRKQTDGSLELHARELVSKQPEHELFAKYIHEAHAAAGKPEQDISKIGEQVKARMEEYRESFMRLEELWFEQDISIMCGGWLEILVRAVEEHEGLILKQDVLGRENWLVELADPAWAENEHIIPDMSSDWLPVEDADTPWEYDEDGWAEDADVSSQGEGSQTAAFGWGEGDEETRNDWSSSPNTSCEYTKDDGLSAGKSTASTDGDGSGDTTS